MKTITISTAAVLLVSLAQVVLGGPPGKERGKELAALEQKLVGAWKGQNGCAGNFLFRADGTYELKGYGPGGDNFAGTWKVRWDALPPTLVLTGKGPLFPEELGELRIIRLDDARLEARYSIDGVHRYVRVPPREKMPDVTEETLKKCIGKTAREVVEHLKLDKAEHLWVDEPPGILRGVHYPVGKKVGFILYIAQGEKLYRRFDEDRKWNYKEFLGCKVGGIQYLWGINQINVGDAVPFQFRRPLRRKKPS